MFVLPSQVECFLFSVKFLLVMVDDFVYKSESMVQYLRARVNTCCAF